MTKRGRPKKNQVAALLKDQKDLQNNEEITLVNTKRQLDYITLILGANYLNLKQKAQLIEDIYTKK